jgi:leucyl aminopeptidase
MALTRAANYAKELANIRGTVADPDYMENKIHELVKDCPMISEVRIIKGQELKE